MGKLLFLCVVILACAGFGSTLYCYQCKFTIFNIRCITSNVTCQPGEVCATIDGIAVGHDLIKKKDCVKNDLCNTNSTDTYLGIKYTTRYKCCEGNACNSAPTLTSAHLSLSLVLAMLGIWLTRQL